MSGSTIYVRQRVSSVLASLRARWLSVATLRERLNTNSVSVAFERKLNGGKSRAGNTSQVKRKSK